MSLEFLEETLKQSGAELASRFGGRNNARQKADDSIVTDADLASERIIIERIKKHFSDDVIFSEESGLSSARRDPGSSVWIIDPLDGTTNFANNYPFFCVSIARGRFTNTGTIEMEEAGIIDPLRERTYLAQRGRGAKVNGTAMRVSDTKDVKNSFLVTGFYYTKGQKLYGEIEKFRRAAEVCSSIRRDGAAALDLALVAEGTFEAFWELGLQPWDVAAGYLLVKEAGGVIINYASQLNSSYNIEGEGIIAGSGSVVNELRLMFGFS